MSEALGAGRWALGVPGMAIFSTTDYRYFSAKQRFAAKHELPTIDSGNRP
jgi:hypothetical protein